MSDDSTEHELNELAKDDEGGESESEENGDDLVDTFNEIAERAILEAEEVECDLAEYRDGLRVMLDAIRNRLAQVIDELLESE